MYALAVIATHLLSGSLFLTAVYLLLYLPTSLLAMVSLYKAWTTDPGAVPLGARPLVTVRQSTSHADSAAVARVRSIRRCQKCNDNFKPARAHHDSVTGRCIIKFDHFCPWICNAVGAKNHKFFCLFLFYTAITCLLSLLFLLVRVIHCGYVRDTDNNDDSSSNDKAAAAAADANNTNAPTDNQRLLSQEYLYSECNDFYGNHVITVLFVASLIFLIFTISMGCEQLEAIETGKSKIARMKMRVGSADTEFTRVTTEFNEMFGGDSPCVTWHWFWPATVTYPRGMEKVVLGYEWDETFDAAPFIEEGNEASSSGSSLNNGGTATCGVVGGDDNDDRELQDMEGGLRSGGRTPSSSNAGLAGSASASLDGGGDDNTGEPDGIMMTRIPSHASSTGTDEAMDAPRPTRATIEAKKGMKMRRLARGTSDEGSSFVDRTKGRSLT